MYELETTNPTVFDHFKDNGFHAIRTSDRYWGGISTDLTIEQILMRSVKTTGGLTRGKGMGEVQRTIWLFSTPICAEIKDASRNIIGVSYEASEQHKEENGTTKTHQLFQSIKWIVGHSRNRLTLSVSRLVRLPIVQ